MNSRISSSVANSSNSLLTEPLFSTTKTTAVILETIGTTRANGIDNATELPKTLIPEQYQVILLSCAYGVISLLALVGNVLIIYIVLRNRRMHSVTNYFICNLALSDSLVACFAIPFQFQAAVLQKWILPHFLCKLAPFVQILCVDVSIYTLVVVSLDRYHVMLHPLKPKLSSKSAFIIFIIIWLIALGSSTPSLFFFNIHFMDSVGYQCLPSAPEQLMGTNSTSKSYDIYKIYVVYNIYSQYIIPFIIISCAYFRIASHLYFSKPVGQTKHQEVIARNKRKVLKMLFLVVALFLICWFPLQLYNFLQVYKSEINDFEHIAVLWLCANWLAMSNSCHNPFIYGFCSAKFNREFRKILSCFPCIDEPELDPGAANKIRQTMTKSVSAPLASATTTLTTATTAAQLRRTNCQRRSPTGSPVLPPVKQRFRQDATPATVAATAKTGHYQKSCSCLSNYKSNSHQTLFPGGGNTNYYSSKMDRSITNCEKFLPDHDLTNSLKEDDLLLVHARQLARFT